MVRATACHRKDLSVEILVLLLGAFVEFNILFQCVKLFWQGSHNVSLESELTRSAHNVWCIVKDMMNKSFAQSPSNSSSTCQYSLLTGMTDRRGSRTRSNSLSASVALISLSVTVRGNLRFGLRLMTTK